MVHYLSRSSPSTFFFLLIFFQWERFYRIFSLYGKKIDHSELKVLKPASDIESKLIRSTEINSAAKWLKSHGILKANVQRDQLRELLTFRHALRSFDVAIGSIQKVKFVAVGDKAVGKSCFWITLTKGKFPQEHESPIFFGISEMVLFGETILNCDYWVS